jgi:hypothetical protein
MEQTKKESLLERYWRLRGQADELYQRRMREINQRINEEMRKSVQKDWKTMTEESSNSESASLEKLLIDNPSDFQFHAAYLTYSNIYDKGRCYRKSRPS